ncbi:MAG: hypothetical protein AAGA77_22760 [Bacteroidota bacterium]
MIKKIIRYIGLLVMGYLLICLITPFNSFLKNRSIEHQITFLSELLDEGYDVQLQNRYPEGKLFSNAILALSVIDYCNRNYKVDERYQTIVDNCIRRIQSSETLHPFNSTMSPAYGMFYNGWVSYVCSEYQKSKLFKTSKLKIEITELTDSIEKRLVLAQEPDLRILDTYAGANWPADNLIGLISLKNDTLKQQWMHKLFQTAKHDSGLIHHSGFDYATIRGSSSAMITFCLNKLNYERIEAYNRTYKEAFVDEFMGIQLVNENIDGSNEMDVDSGPVIFGYGASATIMNIKTQASFRCNHAKYTWAAMNMI